MLHLKTKTKMYVFSTYSNTFLFFRFRNKYEINESYRYRTLYKIVVSKY
jgi:hypothetical protein